MLMLIMSIAVVLDVAEKLDEFLKNAAKLEEILVDYYLNFILYYSNLFSALIIFLAVIWFTAKMARDTEIVPILSSGVSFKRFSTAILLRRHGPGHCFTGSQSFSYPTSQ